MQNEMKKKREQLKKTELRCKSLQRTNILERRTIKIAKKILRNYILYDKLNESRMKEAGKEICNVVPEFASNLCGV